MIPLAHKLKPQSLDEMVGQNHLVGKGAFLRRAVERDEIPSMILYGPPGCGKTSLAHVTAKTTKADFKVVNAVSSGIADLKTVIAAAKKNKESLFNFRTVLFIDEIHRFNKKQQDYLLPFVERGIVTLIGATTENPSFEVVSPLLSRCQVFVLEALSESDILKILENGIERTGGPALEDKHLQFISHHAHGDARFALNVLERLLRDLAATGEANPSESLIRDILQTKALTYDKNGEEHYNVISALHKSMRDGDPDAAVYWIMRMVEAGEDPKYIVRRMIRFASEDIGNADPNALGVAVAAKETVLFLGMPECDTALVQCAAYLAQAPKSNACYVAAKLAKKDVREYGALPAPMHLRNPVTKLMKEWGYGKGYKYAHDYEDARVEQEHFPDRLKGRRYFED